MSVTVAIGSDRGADIQAFSSASVAKARRFRAPGQIREERRVTMIEDTQN